MAKSLFRFGKTKIENQDKPLICPKDSTWQHEATKYFYHWQKAAEKEAKWNALIELLWSDMEWRQFRE